MSKSSISPFSDYKSKILKNLDVPVDVYRDRSPKGALDHQIIDLINTINEDEGLVTTSSCSGRISVFLEGEKTLNRSIETRKASGGGGKGAGGGFLFVSHDPLEFNDLMLESQAPKSRDSNLLLEKFGLCSQDGPAQGLKMIPDSSTRFIHFRFEPMIMSIFASSIDSAMAFVAAGEQAGFRESGVAAAACRNGQVNRIPATVRAPSLGFDSIVGYLDEQSDPLDIDQRVEDAINGEKYLLRPSGVKQRRVALVDETYLRLLVQTANERFKVNEARIERFRKLLMENAELRNEPKKDSVNVREKDWEDDAVRKERKRAEGLQKQAAISKARSHTSETTEDAFGNDELDMLEILNK